MHLLKKNLLPFEQSSFFTLIVLISTYSFARAEETIFFEEFYQPPAQELDLTVDLNTFYRKSDRPNFSGSWLIDISESDNPEEILKEIKKGKNKIASRGNRSATGRGSKGSGSRGGRGNRNSKSYRGNRSNNTENLGHREIAKMLVNEMHITHHDPLLKIYSNQIDERTIYTDFRSTSISAMGGVNQQITVSGWEGNGLVIETTKANGQKIIQTLKLLNNPQRVEVITEIPTLDINTKPVRIRQIYVKTNQQS